MQWLGLSWEAAAVQYQGDRGASCWWTGDLAKYRKTWAFLWALWYFSYLKKFWEESLWYVWVMWKQLPYPCVHVSAWCKNLRKGCWKNPKEKSAAGLLQLQIFGVLENTCIRRPSSCRKENPWKYMDFLTNSLLAELPFQTWVESKLGNILIVLKWYLLYNLWTFLNNFNYIFGCLVFVLHLSLMYKIDLCVLFNFPLQISCVSLPQRK